MGLFDVISNSFKNAAERTMLEKYNEYRRMSSYDVEEWVPNIQNGMEKAAAILALADNSVSKAIEVARKNNIPKNYFARFGSHPQLGKAAREIVQRWDNYY